MPLVEPPASSADHCASSAGQCASFAAECATAASACSASADQLATFAVRLTEHSQREDVQCCRRSCGSDIRSLPGCPEGYAKLTTCSDEPERSLRVDLQAHDAFVSFCVEVSDLYRCRKCGDAIDAYHAAVARADVV